MACPDLPTVTAKNIDELVWEDCCRVFERLEQIQAVVEKNIEETIASMLEDTEGKKLVASLQQEIQYAEIEQKKHPEGSYYYSLIAEDISKKKILSMAFWSEEPGSFMPYKIELCVI